MPAPAVSSFAALLLAGIGGWLTDLAFPDRGWWPLAYVGIAVLLLTLRRAQGPRAALLGLAWGLGFFLPHVHWAVEASGSYLPWAALAVAQALYVAGYALAWTWARRAVWVRDHPVAQVVLAAVLWVAVEQLRGSWPFGGFPWATLAFSQSEAPLVRLAPVGGEVLVSAAVVVVGALLAVAWHRLRRLRVGAASGALVVALVVVFAPWAVPLDAAAESGTLRVGAVQGNVPEQGAEWSAQARAVTANHARGTEQLLEDLEEARLDLLLWPESAADIDPRTDAEQAALVDDAARAAGVPLLLGAQRFPEEDVRYNEMVLWQPGEGAQAAYTKQHPVPFGEYVPYRDFFRRITPLVDLIGTDMAAGDGAALLAVPIERLGREVAVVPAICFEVAYRDLVREGVVGGGELLVVPTNNASFGHSQESAQQLAMSRFRAVEHGRATVQVSTVGVSAIIMPNGVVVDRTALWTADQLSASVPLRTSLTPAARLGAAPEVAAYAVAALAVVVGLLSGRRRERRRSRR